MARRRGPSRGRGRREEATVAQPVAEPLDFAEPERPSRASARGRSSGGGGGGSTIGLVIPLAVTATAAICLLAGGFIIASAAKKGAVTSFDTAGANAALTLAAGEPDWWEQQHGVSKGVYRALLEKKNDRIKDVKKKPDFDSRDLTVIENEFKELISKWDLKATEMDAQGDTIIITANQSRLQRLIKNSEQSIIYAAIYRSDGKTRYAYSGSSPEIADYGYTDLGPVRVHKVLADGIPARMFVAPIYDRFNLHAGGQPSGKAEVILDARVVNAATDGLTVTVIVISLVGLLVVGLISFMMCLGASKGVSRIARDLHSVAQGDLDVRISAKGGGEVTALARAADRAMKTFRAVQEQSFAAAAAPPVAVAPAEAMDTSALLPSEPPRVDGYEVEAVHKPSAEGANDYFDYITVDDDHLGVIIADMPHPGPRGAFVASTFRALVRAYGIGETSPAVVLSRVNRVMAGELKRGDHITAMYAVLDKKNGILSVASAGHLPLVFWKFEKKGSALLNPEGIAIGLDKGPVFEKTVVDKRIKIEKGDRFVLYTDGPVAARNFQEEEFGEQRFYYLVNREAPKNSAAFVNFVANEVDLFHEGAVQLDDITLVTVRRVS